MENFDCATSKDTKMFGEVLGSFLSVGDVICLNGDLGAGKTLISKGIAQSQGVPEAEVTSPTFAIMNIYEGNKCPIRHFDLYRLNRLEELEDIGFDEYVGEDGITLIEWSELFPEAMPAEFLEVLIKIVPEGRKIILKAQGQHYENLSEKVAASVNFRD